MCCWASHIGYARLKGDLTAGIGRTWCQHLLAEERGRHAGEVARLAKLACDNCLLPTNGEMWRSETVILAPAHSGHPVDPGF